MCRNIANSQGAKTLHIRYMQRCIINTEYL